MHTQTRSLRRKVWTHNTHDTDIPEGRKRKATIRMVTKTLIIVKFVLLMTNVLSLCKYLLYLLDSKRQVTNNQNFQGLKNYN